MVLCVTGPMAAGKNFVSSLIENLVIDGKPFVSIDADICGHKAVDNATEKIIEAFGNLAKEKGIQLVDSNGKIIRRNLGALIFGNKELVAKQESIVYPEITSIIEDFIEENKDKNIIVNATLLYKVPVMQKIDSVIFVDCPTFIRFLRAKKRDGIKSKQILARFKSQRGLYSSYKKTGAKIHRIWNLGGKNSLIKKIQILITNC